MLATIIEFEDSLQPTLQGIQQSGKSAQISAFVGAATTNGLRLIASGTPPKLLLR